MEPRSPMQLHHQEAAELAGLGRRLRAAIEPGRWAAEGPSGRRRLARQAHELIREGYGLPPRQLRFAFDWPPGQLGAFDPATGELAVNRSLLLERDPTRVLAALAHENRHDLQQERIAGSRRSPRAPGGEVELWRAADLAYTVGDEVRYVYNALEVDAREAARAVVDDGFWGTDRELRHQREPRQRGAPPATVLSARARSMEESGLDL